MKKIRFKKLIIKGSILLEALLLLIISNLSVTVISQLMRQYYFLQVDIYQTQDLITVFQLESLFMTSTIVEVDDDSIELLIGEETFYIEQVNANIILTPGTQILFLDVEETYFLKEETHIKINFMRKNKEKEYYVEITK